MNFNEIDSAYKKAIEDAEKEFLEKIKKDGFKALKEAEAEYKSKIKAAREDYYRAVQEFLNKEKSSIKESAERQKLSITRKNAEEISSLKVEPLNLELGFFQRLQLRTDFLIFKLKLNWRKELQERIPEEVLYILTLLRVKLSRQYFIFKTLSIQLLEAAEHRTKKAFFFLEHLFKESIKKANSMIQGIISKILKEDKEKQKA